MIEQQTIEKIPEEIGRNFKTIMGSFTFTSAYKAIEEIVKNSYDADAPRVDIIYYPKTETLIIADNGEGMNVNGLRSFMRLGDSPKLDRPITSEGRRVLGNLCVAKTALRHLAYVQTIETLKNRVKRTFQEAYVREIVNFSLKNNHDLNELEPEKKNKCIEEIIRKIAVKKVSPRKIPEIKDTSLIGMIEDKYGPLEKIRNKGEFGGFEVTKKSVQSRSGTTITMHPLKFGREKAALDLKQLERHLRENLGELLSPGFNIFINDKKLMPIKIENAMAFKIDTYLEKCGEVRGKIFYSPPPNPTLKFKGLHIFVDNARAGQVPGIDLFSKKYGVANRVLGIIHVNSLRDKTLLSRLDHVHDDPRMTELSDYLKGELNMVINEARKISIEEQGKKMRSIMKSAARKVEGCISKSSLPGQTQRKSKTKTEELTITLSSSKETGPLGGFNPKTREVVISSERRVIHDFSTQKRLEQFFTDNSLLLIAREKVIDPFPEYQDGIDVLFSEISELEKKLIKQSKSKALSQYAHDISAVKISKHPDQMPINKIRLYTKRDLPKITGRERIVFTRAIETGLLEKKEMWTGQEIRELMETLYKHLTVEEIIREYISIKSELKSQQYTYHESILKRNIQQFGVKEGIVKNISNSKMPFYIVPETRINQFLETYHKRGKRTKAEEKEELLKLRQIINFLKTKTKKNITTGMLKKISSSEDFLNYTFRSNIDQGYSKKGVMLLAEKINTNEEFCRKYKIY